MVFDLQNPSSGAVKPEEVLVPINNRGSIKNFYLNMLKRRWWIIAGSAIVGLIPMIVWTQRTPLTYGGFFELLVEPVSSAQRLADPSVLARGGAGGGVNEQFFALDYPTVIRILRSDGFLQRVVDEVIRNNPSVTPAFLANELRTNLVVERARETPSRFDTTKVISVKFKGENPKIVLEVLESLSRAYLEYGREDRDKNRMAGIEFVDEQLPNVRERIENLQNKQKELQKANELVDPAVKGQYVFEVANTNQQAILAAETELEELRVLSRNLQNDLGLSPSEAIIASTLSQDPERQALFARLLEVESNLALESAQLTETHPTILNLKDQRDNLKNLVDRETARIFRQNNIDPTNINPRVLAYQDSQRIALMGTLIETQNRLDALQVRYESLTRNQDGNNQELTTIPEVIKEYNDLNRQLELDTSILDKFTLQRETLAMELSQQQTPWQLLAPPTIPTDEFGRLRGFPPDPTKKWAAGVLGGGFLGLLGAFVLEKRKDVVYEQSDLEYAFGFPTLGTIAVGKKQKIKQELGNKNFFGGGVTENNQQEDQLILPQQALSEIYANLYYQLPYSNQNYIVVSSIDHQPYQGAIVANVARTAAEVDQKVLFIDATPQELTGGVEQFFPKPVRKGMKNLLQFEEEDQTIIENNYQENISILTAGLRNTDLPANLSTPDTQSLIQKIAQDYSLIIYNSNAFTDSYDLNLLVEKTQGLVLLVQLEKTPLSLISESISRIRKFDLNFLGFIVVG